MWFSGQKAWFYNPSGANQTARYTGGRVITPKAGLASIPVYGAAYPEASAYPAAVPVTKIVKLSYAIPAGQEYPTIGAVPTATTTLRQSIPACQTTTQSSSEEKSMTRSPSTTGNSSSRPKT